MEKRTLKRYFGIFVASALDLFFVIIAYSHQRQNGACENDLNSHKRKNGACENDFGCYEFSQASKWRP